MGLEHIRMLKEQAKLPKEKKKYVIPKVSAKRKIQMVSDKETFEKDKIFYKEVYDASPHICIECGVTLPKTPMTFMFHHLLPKSKYPQFRHTHENIAIVCLECHSKAETNLQFAPKINKRRLEVEKLLLS